jgi:hypothetical protein
LNQELLQIVKEIDDSQTSHEAILRLKKFRSGNKEFDDWCIRVLASVKDATSQKDTVFQVSQVSQEECDDVEEEVIDNSLYIIK